MQTNTLKWIRNFDCLLVLSSTEQHSLSERRCAIVSILPVMMISKMKTKGGGGNLTSFW